jgi:hypothetical protein
MSMKWLFNDVLKGVGERELAEDLMAKSCSGGE